MAEKYKVSVELQFAMYNALSRITYEYKKLKEEYENTKSSLTFEEKNLICDKAQVYHDDFYGLLPYYKNYKDNPSLETEMVIKKKYGNLLEKESVNEITDFSKEAILDKGKDEKEEIIEKPVLDLDSEDDEPVIDFENAPAQNSEEYRTIDEWCDIAGIKLMDYVGFNEEQLKPGAKMTMKDFYDAASKSKCAFPDLGEKSM